jgi:hypothetical protein
VRFKTQRRWAVVHNFSGHIDHSTIAFNRRDVVGAIVSVWRNYTWFTTKHPCQLGFLGCAEWQPHQPSRYGFESRPTQ